MEKKNSNQEKRSEIRKRAEEILRSKRITKDNLSDVDIRKLIHELDVHQIELEMQNDELRRAQIEIEESRKKFFDLYNFAPVGYLTFDKNGKILDANHTFSIQIGVEKKLLMNKNFGQYIVKEDQDDFYFFRNKIFENKNIETCELRLRSKGDNIIYAQLDSAFTTDSNGNEFCKTAVTDITKCKLAEDALRKSEASLVKAQSLAHLGDWDWDITNDKLRWSKEVHCIFGLPQRKFSGNFEAFLALIHPDDREFVKKSVNEALYKNKPFNFDHRILRPNGKERIVHTQAKVTLNDAGKPVRMIGTVHDITERKEIEEELIRAQKLESVGLLAGGIAHDFNNILTAILGYTTLGQVFTKREDSVYDLLVKIEKASFRAKNLTQQLLTFSKGGKPVKKTTSISGLIKDATEFALRGSNVSCEFSIPGDLWAVEVDEDQIYQVINNLVINAVQAMTQGGIINVNVKNVSEDESRRIISLKFEKYVSISIKDQGVGISEKILPKIFDPYFTTKENGSGLGLTSSYSIINNHGGLITVQSEINVGTTFHVYLPASSKKITKKKEKEEKPFTGKGKILVLDDDDAIRDMAGQMMSYIGYEVECAKDGAEAIDMYKMAIESDKPFDVVIMDLTIPGGMGGKEAIKKLVEIDPEVKAIVFSGYSNDPIMADYKKYGFKGVISKPFNIQDMNDLLGKVIEG